MMCPKCGSKLLECPSASSDTVIRRTCAVCGCSFTISHEGGKQCLST